MTSPLPALDPLTRPTGRAFDVCHVGVVLRALLLVEGVLAVGTAFVADGPVGWLTLTASASVAALPGVLLWLMSACLLRHGLSRLTVFGQWGSAGLLGAGCGAVGWLLASASGLEFFDPQRWSAPALAGAALGVAMLQWLRLRVEARLPAEATARLAELQSRIRPHFLFNTLNTALSLVRLDPARAEAVLEDLAELFRGALDRGLDQDASLADEIDLARRYLAIEQLRFGDRLRVAWEIDPAAGPARLPALLLQPLVENAVRHGIEPMAGGGELRVQARIRQGRVEIEIVNSVGDGPSRPGNGIALRNVHERLRLMHDVASDFEAQRAGDEYRVRIAVPLP